MGKSKYKGIVPTDFDDVSTYELASRPSKVNIEAFARPLGADEGLKPFFESLPDVLAVKSLREVAARIVAESRSRAIRS